jgi:hypothetical protein
VRAFAQEVLVAPDYRFTPLLLSFFLIALLTACGGASESDFVEACLLEAGDSSAQQLAICECGADAAASTLSSEAYKAMVLEMAGKNAEAREITAKLNESEQMEMINAVGRIYEDCFLN